MATVSDVRGRDPLLAAIRDRCERALLGGSSMLILQGSAGFGKTRVLEAAADLAERVGMRPGYGRADAGDHPVPMGPFFGALFDGPKPLVDPGARSRLHYLPEQRYWLLEEVESLFERAALEHPLLVAIDDAQWADSGSLLALRTLLPRLASLPIAWLIAMRTTGLPSELRTLTDRMAAEGASRVQLAPLNEAAVAEIVCDLTGAVPGPDLLQLAGRAGGSPFLLVEMVRGLREEGLIRVVGNQAVLVENRLPARVGESMRARLNRMPELTRRVARTASVLGRSFSFDQLAAMTGQQALALLVPVEELLAGDLLAETGDMLTFSHDLVRDAVRDTLPATALRSLQRQAVDALLSTGSPPVEIAVQLAQSAEPGDDAAVDSLRQVASSLAISNPDAAADLSRRALELASPRHPSRVALVVETAIHLHAAARIPEAKAFTEGILRQALTSEQEAEVLLSIANMYGLSADFRADAGVRALALPDVSPLTRARHLAFLAHNRTTGGRAEEAAALLVALQAAVERTGDVLSRYTLELVESGLHYLAGRFGPARERAEACVRTSAGLDEPNRTVLVHYWRAEVYSVLDRHDEALQLTAANLSSAQRDRQVWGSFLYEGGRGRHLLQVGRLDDAFAALEPAVEAAENFSLAGVLDAAALVALGEVAVHTGDAHRLQRCLAFAEALWHGGTPAVKRHAEWLFALSAMAAGDVTRAHSWARTSGDPRPNAIEARLPLDVTNKVDLMRIALAADDAGLADLALAGAQDQLENNPTVVTIAGVAAHCRGLRKGDLADLDEAIEVFASGPRPVALASALEDAGRLAAGQGRTDHAVTALSRSLETYARCGATWDAARVRGRLRRLGVHRRLVAAKSPRHGWAGLTEAELAVVRLVADGLSNREIATRLYLSPHTVSGHLRHAFEKLGINSRVALARIVADGLDRPAAESRTPAPV